MYEEYIEIKKEFRKYPRLASRFVDQVSKYESEIYIIKDGKEYNAKSIISFLSLGLDLGDKIKLKVEEKEEENIYYEVKELL